MMFPLAHAIHNVRQGQRALRLGFPGEAGIHLACARHWLGAGQGFAIIDGRINDHHHRARLRQVEQHVNDLGAALALAERAA